VIWETSISRTVVTSGPDTPLGGSGASGELRQILALRADPPGCLPEPPQLVIVEIELDDLLDSSPPQTGWDSDVDIGDAVLPGRPRTHRQDLPRVGGDRVHHLRRGRRRRMVRAALLEERHD